MIALKCGSSRKAKCLSATRMARSAQKEKLPTGYFINMIEQKCLEVSVRLISSEKSWIEGEAIRQLHYTAGFKGMKMCVGLPDLHPGKATPIGAAFFTEKRIYPTIVGNDIGCGIGLWRTTLQRSKIKRDHWAKKLKSLKGCDDAAREKAMHEFSLVSTPFDNALGSIGSGNHFAELQQVEKVFCLSRISAFSVDPKQLLLMVHSGSRGLGSRIFADHAEKFGGNGLSENSSEAKQYIADHDFALQWAACNRSLIASQFGKALGSGCTPLCDHVHNSLSRVNLEGGSGFLHRKGAVASDNGVVVIPGSRGSFSYLVEPIGQQKENLYSLAHGAGRKWNRSSCKALLRNRKDLASLTNTSLGSVVVYDDAELLYEEAPQAYKNIETVIDDMEKEKMIRVIATLRPIITCKIRRFL